MTAAVPLVTTRCAICGTENNSTELYPANFDMSAFSPAIFSARRLPDGIHYRLVKCNTCGLVRSDPVADEATLAGLYAKSTFDYSAEVDNLKMTYGRYLRRVIRAGASTDSLLEVGCGNGFILSEARACGFKHVHGVEPGEAVVAAAPPDVRPSIVCDILRPGLFPPSSFDVICMFQVFDHLAKPEEMLSECLNLLRQGGFLLLLHHNVESVSAKLLKEKSPIIDIEHTYLYSPRTMRLLLQKCGYVIVESGTVMNTYSLAYFVHLLPLPAGAKMHSMMFMNRLARRVRLRLPLGNMYIIARKAA